eukprot:scaffold35820_cov65-Phaeocystis_antarctica.AAC.5
MEPIQALVRKPQRGMLRRWQSQRRLATTRGSGEEASLQRSFEPDRVEVPVGVEENRALAVTANGHPLKRGGHDALQRTLHEQGRLASAGLTEELEGLARVQPGGQAGQTQWRVRQPAEEVGRRLVTAPALHGRGHLRGARARKARRREG